MIPAQKILDKAAMPTLERIRRDRQKAPQQIRPLLAYLETHLFDPELDANQLKRACGVRDNSLPIQFHHALSLPPYAYIEDCRLEVACRLLSDSPLKIWQIAQLLGYSTLQVFSRAFHRWSGLRPSVFRRRAKETREAATKRPGSRPSEAAGAETAEETLLSFDILRRAVQGGLARDEADELSSHLARLYPGSFQRPAKASSAHSSEASEALEPSRLRLSAEESWSLLSSRQPKLQREMIRCHVELSSIDLFQLLLCKSLEAGRQDRQAGVTIAELALDCLATQKEVLPSPELQELEARGLANLANARRLAFDYPGTEHALNRAERRLTAHTPPLVRAEVAAIKAGFRTDQRHLDEALELIDRALVLVEDEGSPEHLVRYLLQRIQIRYYQGKAGSEMAALRRAFELLDKIDDRYLQLSVYQVLTVVLSEGGSPREAAQYLPIARRICEEGRIDRALPHMEWMQALLERDLGRPESAEAYFRQARDGFLAGSEHLPAAMVALDLAMLYAEQGRYFETLDLASEMLPNFEAMKVNDRESLMALRILQEAVRTEQLSVVTLRKIRSYLKKVVAPTA